MIQRIKSAFHLTIETGKDLAQSLRENSAAIRSQQTTLSTIAEQVKYLAASEKQRNQREGHAR